MYIVIYKFKNDDRINTYEIETNKSAEVMVKQLMSNPEIEFANISDDATKRKG